MEVLTAAWSSGLPVPYPVAHKGSVVVLQYLGDETMSAPRLIDARLTSHQAQEAAASVMNTVVGLAELGYIHGDLSPFNILWWQDRAWVIDFPQTVDGLLHPSGPQLLRRDIDNSLQWFRKYGIDVDTDAAYNTVVSTLFRRS